MIMSICFRTLIVSILCFWSTGIFAVEGEERVKVVTTTSQIGDVVLNILGDLGEVYSLMGTDVDPHLYQPTRSDMVLLLDSDIIFYNGLHLEGRMEELFEQLAYRKRVIAVGEELRGGNFLDWEDGDGFDPHIWMDVSIWREVAVLITEVLSDFAPGHAVTYKSNAERYIERLDRLEGYIHWMLSGIEDSRRVLVTAHDAFNYFGRAYGFEVVGIQGISTESEASLGRMEEIVDILIQRRIGAIFVETSVSDRHVRALVEGVEARGHRVEIGGRLFSDAMGVSGTYEGTYIGMMEYNVRQIARALGGYIGEYGWTYIGMTDYNVGHIAKVWGGYTGEYGVDWYRQASVVTY